MEYAAVIAAAGLSSRMRDFKPMMCLNDRTMITDIILSFQKAGIREIVVVTGYHAELLEKHIAPLNVRTCRNPAYAETEMIDSLRLGLGAIQDHCEAAFLSPADVPLISSETIRRMMDTPGEAVRPVFIGKAGHPVLVRGEVLRRVQNYHGSGGLRKALQDGGTVFTDLKVDDPGILLGADTPREYKQLREEELRIRNGGKLWPEIRVGVMKGAAGITPEAVQFLEMIGHTGSIRDACKAVHFSYTKGWKLLNEMETTLGYPLTERKKGGQTGGGSVLTEQGEKFLSAYQAFQSSLKEAAAELFDQLFS